MGQSCVKRFNEWAPHSMFQLAFSFELGAPLHLFLLNAHKVDYLKHFGVFPNKMCVSVTTLTLGS